MGINYLCRKNVSWLVVQTQVAEVNRHTDRNSSIYSTISGPTLPFAGCGSLFGVSAICSPMKRKTDLFEGLAEFEEDIPDAKRYKLVDDELAPQVEHALGGPTSVDAVHSAPGTLNYTSYKTLQKQKHGI